MKYVLTKLQSDSSFAGIYLYVLAALLGASPRAFLSFISRGIGPADFMFLQPKFYRRCCKRICLNNLHAPSQRNVNGELGLPLMLCNRGCFTENTEWRGNYGVDLKPAQLSTASVQPFGDLMHGCILVWVRDAEREIIYANCIQCKKTSGALIFPSASKLV